MWDLDQDFLIKLAIAIFCSSAIGFERQIRGKPMGIRTSILICLSTMSFITLSRHLHAGDPSRVLAQVVSGVGFLGAGVILTKDGLVLGVTSAAVVWVLASVGAAIGFERYAYAIVLSLVVVSVLIGVEYLELLTKMLRKGVHKHLNS